MTTTMTDTGTRTSSSWRSASGALGSGGAGNSTADPVVLQAMAALGRSLAQGNVNKPGAAPPNGVALASVPSPDAGAGPTNSDAGLWARYSGVASDAELSDPEFLVDLDAADDQGYGTVPEAVHYARAQLLGRRIGVDPLSLLPMSVQDLTALLGIDPGQVQKLMGRGLNLQQISQTSEAERTALLGGDERFANLVRALLLTGMTVPDVVAYADTVVTVEEATPEFLEQLRQRIAGGASGAAAIAGARYGDELSAEELASPDFLNNLLFSSSGWEPRGQHAIELISALAYLREHGDIFDAAEKISLGGAPDDWFTDGKFNGVAIGQLNNMGVDSPEWAQLEATLGRGLSTDERYAAIDAAHNIMKHWAFLHEHRAEMNLTWVDSNNDFGFTRDNLRNVNMSPLIATVDNTQASLLFGLDYLRNHIDLFDSAESVAKSSERASDGKFVNYGVFKIASMDVDDQDWQFIDRTMSPEERQRAITAAKCLTDNWDTLYARAAELGLSPDSNRTIDGRVVIFFKSDMLASLKLDLLLPTSSALLAYDRPTALQYARAKYLEKDLATEGVPTVGADFGTLMGLSPAQLKQLVAMDAESIKMLLYQHPVGGIADLSVEAVNSLANIDASLLRWLVGLANYTLAEIAKLTPNDLAALGKANSESYRNATASEDFNDIKSDTISQPIDLGGGMLIFETNAGERILVTKETNFNLHAKVADLLEARTQAAITAVRTEFGLLSMEEMDILSLSTTKLNDPNNTDSGYMTVGGQLVQTLVEKYHGMLDRGEMAQDDPRAKLMRAFEARNALANGYSLLPYYESPTSFGSTYRIYPGGEDDTKYSTMTPADVAAMIDPAKVDAQIKELLGNPTIQTDYQAALDASVATLPDKEGLRSRMYNSVISPEFTEALKSLKDKGLVGEAERMVSDAIQSIAMLNPAQAAEAAQILSVNALTLDMQTLMDDPSLVDNATFDQAITDAIALTLQALRSGSSIVRHGSQSTADLIKYLEETLDNKKLVTALADTYKQLVIDAKTTGTFNLGNITQADFDAALAKTYVPLELRGGVSGFFGKTQKYGVWGSVGGAAAMAAFGYKYSQGAWGSDSTALERWGAARDIISFLSVVGHVTKSSAGLIDSFRSMIGTNADGEAAWKALGLDRTLPEVWGKTSFLPAEFSWAQTWDHYQTTGTFTVTTEYRDDLGKQLKEAADKLGDMFAKKAPNSLLPGGVGARLGVSMLKILGTITDLAGIADIVVGALGLKRSIADKDAGAIAANTLGIAGGAALTGAGIIGTAGLFAAAPAAIAAATAPLFLVGAVLALAGFVVTALLATFKRHNQLQNASEDQTQWFRDLNQDGLAAPDWFEKSEYLRYAWSIYGNDDTDDKMSYFEFQQAEWEHFRDTPGEKGSSLNRLDSNLHVYTDLTTEDPRDYASSGPSDNVSFS